MKKFLALVLALVMVFALAACGEEPAAPAGSDAPEGGAPSSGKSSVALDRTMQCDWING